MVSTPCKHPAFNNSPTGLQQLKTNSKVKPTGLDLGFRRSPTAILSEGDEESQITGQSSNEKVLLSPTIVDICSEKPIALTAGERKQQDALVQFLVGDSSIKNLLAKSTCWYCAYLQSKFKQHWHLLAATLVGIDENSTVPRPGDLAVVYTFLLEIAKLLKSTPELALVTIVDELDNESLVKPQLDEERALPNQAVFAAIGWLSRLNTESMVTRIY